MKSRCLAALAVALLAGPVSGCGGTPIKHPAPAPYVAPESARTPDGAKPVAAPALFAPRGSLLGIGARHISTRGLHLIEGFEGWSSCPYWDSYGGVWTRGYGETEGISGGSACISRAQGELKLRLLVEARYEWALRGLGVSLNQNQWDALCSFVWNLGAGIFQGTSVGADLRVRNWQGAASSMLQYVHAGGVVLAGLVTRRRAEVALFLAPVSKPASLRELYARRRALRRRLSHYGCRTRRAKHEHLGPKCARWFVEGAETNGLIHTRGGH
ncbi:MAG: glycoside hydrolase family protein [Solirubrobacteraceae bacterium]